MRRIILWSSLALALSASVSGCSDADRLGERVSALEKEVAALEESVGRLNSNAVILHMASSGSYFLKEVVRHDYGYALEFTDGTVCDVFFGADAPAKEPLLSISGSGEWMVSMDGGKVYVPVEGASNAFSQDGVTPQFRVADGIWQVSVDKGLSWSVMPGSPSEAVSFFRSVVYDDAAGILTLVLSDGKEVSVSLAVPGQIGIAGYQAGAAINAGEEVRYQIVTSGVSEIIPRLPSGWTLVISDGEMTVGVSEDVQAGEAEITLILVSEEGLVKQVDLNFTVVSE